MSSLSQNEQRIYIAIRGAVQGVGFRPFIYRLATDLKLCGWVKNSAQGVFIEAEGPPALLTSLVLRIEKEKPPRAVIQSLETSFLEPVGYTDFTIRHSEESGVKSAFILPDIATCADCREEIFTPGNRRYHYPFTNCTNCGPRFTIIQALPYDRPNTTMRKFVMCKECQAEYENPLDRRFHAQPNACPVCGPHLELWDRQGKRLADAEAALQESVRLIRQGHILAIKGLGGFHLVVDARNEDAVRLLRRRKNREEKPFASMYPSVDAVKKHCQVDSIEERLLGAPEAPIVLLHQRASPDAGRATGSDATAENLSSLVNPHNPYLGIMLPYTPLHHLLLAELKFPLVATSGNISDEPICIDEYEALARLGNIADFFLIHNRPIARHIDDSIARVCLGRELILRRARGYAPLPISAQEKMPPVLAVGAHLKNTVAIAIENNMFVSQHIGDLTTEKAFAAFQESIRNFAELYDFKAQAVVCDLHPDYLSGKFAHSLGLPVVAVQHHYAHVLSCMAENQAASPVLGVSWDGTGYGTDGSIWGGEFLKVTEDGFARIAHLRSFCLPGGEKAIREPKRIALSLVYEICGAALWHEATPYTRILAPLLDSFSTAERKILPTILAQKLNAPVTSSVGRLFDAVASLAGIRHTATYEGQAAMELEFALDGIVTTDSYSFALQDANRNSVTWPSAPSLCFPLICDWEPVIVAILQDLLQGVAAGVISARFHNTLAQLILTLAKISGLQRIVLNGGCFQNKYLLENAVQSLRANGFQAYWPQRIPPNDGGIAIGQLCAARLIMASKSGHGIG